MFGWDDQHNTRATSNSDRPTQQLMGIAPSSLMQFHYDFYSVHAASLKSFGERTAGLFDRKKKDAEKLAEEKAEEAKKMAEEQARTLGESIGKTKSEAEQLAASTGKLIELFLWTRRMSVVKAANSEFIVGLKYLT